MKKRGTHTDPSRGTGYLKKKTGKPTPYFRIAWTLRVSLSSFWKLPVFVTRRSANVMSIY